jgi:hypothetical protein
METILGRYVLLLMLMLNNPSLISVTEAFPVSVTRTLQAVELMPAGIAHAKVLEDAIIEAVITDQFAPSVVYSILTFVTLVLVHVMFWVVPAVQDSPPLGEVTTTLADDTIENNSLLSSLTAAFEASLTRT